MSGQAIAGGPALVFDPADGMVIYAEDADDQWHPASLTKIMTAYITFEAVRTGKFKLEDRIPYSARAQSQPPSKLGLNLTATLTIDQAIKALVIKSANDVAVMLAEAVGGSQPEFVARMNQTAQRLGMTRTTFVNPNGLPAAEQVTTARDLAKLARAVYRDYPEYAPYWSMFDAHIGKIVIGTHNGLLHSFEGADGMKTGFICDSGFNLVASATRDGRRLMAVVLGEQTGRERTIRAANLLEHGFQSVAWKHLFTTTSIDTMAIAPDARSVTSMRKNVVSYECGTGGRRKANKAKAKTVKSKKKGTEAAVEAPVQKASATGTKVADQVPPPAAGATAAPTGEPAKKKVAKPPVEASAAPAAKPVKANAISP
jgi:D-alanyl-D-alanine carboxypeptidase